MNKYKQLTEVQRYQIKALNKAQKEQKKIAEIIGVSASTIYRELKENRDKRISSKADSFTGSHA